MTKSNCAVCGGDLIERGPQSTLVCEGCGRVNDDHPVEGKTESSGQQSGFVTERTPNKATDWEESVEISDSTDEKLVEILIMVDEIGDMLDAASSERNRAAEVVTTAWENRLLVGSSIEVAVGACWYITFREQGEPRPIGVVSNIADVKSSKLHSFRRKAINELDLRLNVVRPAEYLPFLCSQLNLSPRVLESAQEILGDVCVSGNPAGVAAAGLYVAAHDTKEAVTMREAAQTAQLSKETIWQRVDDLRNQ